MRIEVTIDGKFLALSVSSDKPLNLLLIDELEARSMKTSCRGGMCGNCIVLLDGKAVLSCLVPAFEIRNRTVLTFDGFSRTRDYRDIEKAYAACDMHPCHACHASRTLLIESIVRRCEISTGDFDEDEILQESALVACTCMDSAGFIRVVREALANRRKRKNVRRA